MSEKQKAVALFASALPKKVLDIDHKQDLLRACAEKSHFTIVAFIAMRRASFERLSQAVELCRSYQAHALIIDEFATLCVPPKQLLTLIELINEHGISLIDANTGASFLYAHQLSLKGLFYTSNEAEKTFQGTRIKRALRKRKRQGIRLGARKFGEQDHEALAIKQIVELYDSGLSLQKICNVLRSNHIKSVRNKNWHPTTIKRILERENKMAFKPTL